MENSHIAWTSHTFNPWTGCQKVSDGCKFCYAEALRDGRFGKNEWGPKGTRTRTSEANWTKPLHWNATAARLGIRYKVFCASLADVFEDRAELIPWRAELLDIIRKTPNLDWQILTKRPENIRRMLREATCVPSVDMDLLHWVRNWEEGLVIPWNAWLGISAENQETHDERWPFLRDTPAAVRFVSYEPALGPLRLWQSIYEDQACQQPDWLICGGESGPNARPFNIAWARSIRGECQAAGVPFFMKQMGSAPEDCANGMGRRALKFRDPKGGDMDEWPPDLRIRQFPNVPAHVVEEGL